MRLLVTGAAGLIGRALVASLAERGHAVVALLHRSTALAGNDGTVLRAAPFVDARTSLEPGQIATLRGDVSRDGLGLAPEAVDALAPSLDVVVHAAALTGFNLDAEAYARVNVGGMRHVLAFAARSAARPIPVLAVSTAYVCGERNGPIEEEPRHPDAPFANGYERSKADAEALALRAIGAGQPVAIARPSIVVGAFADGTVGEFGNLYQLIRLVAEGRIRVLPASPGATLDLVPIDHVVAGLADLAGRMSEAAGGIFHLVSGRPVPVASLRTLADAFPSLNPPRFVAADRFDPTRLGTLERRLNLSVTDLFASYLRRDPRFDDTRFRRLTGRRCPPTDDAFLRRLIAYALGAGFIVPPAERTGALAAAAALAAQRTSG